MNRQKIQRRGFLLNIGKASAVAGLVTAPATVFGNKGNAVIPAQSDIKITNIKTYRLYRAILVRVETNVGVVGWGECSPNSTEVIESFIHHTMKKFLIGQDPFNVELIWDTLFWQNHDLGPSGALPYAIAGIDLALWDIKGKVLNVPVYRLLGGMYREEVPAYGGFGVYGGSVSVDEAKEKALKLAEKGFKFIKLRMQIREYNLDPYPDFTLKYYEGVRKALSNDVELFVDPNEGYTAARAIEIGLELQSMGMKYYESPTPLENHRDLAEVVKAINIPVMAGEKCYTRWQFRDLILEANPDIIQPDLIKAGGITEVKKIAALGQTFFKTIAPHNTKPTLGTAAAMHLMASISNAGPFIEFIETEIYEEVMSVFDNQVEFKNGKLLVPKLAGLGLEINEKRLEKLVK